MSLQSVQLRSLQPKDFEVLVAIENDPKLWRYSNQNIPYSEEVLSAYIENQHRSVFDVRQKRFVITNATQIPIGFIDLFDFEIVHQRAGVGIVILEEYRNMGYGKKSLLLLEVYAINKLNIKNLYANIGAENQPSIQLFSSSGFERVGVKKNWNFYDGSYHDEYLFQKEYKNV